MAFGSAALKLFQTVLYGIEFCCAGIILGIYSYFLSVLADRDLPIATWVKAVTGLSGAAVLYTIFGVLLTCFLGGKTFFALLGVIFDLLFCGAFIALAVLTRDGAHSCSGNVDTPIGNGSSRSKQGFGSNGQQGRQITFAVSLGSACRMNKACFAVAIVGAILFLLSALVHIALNRKHKHDKRYGPSPTNNYTRGSGVKFFGRKKRDNGGMRDAEMAGAAAPATSTLAPGAHDYRPSHDTAYTGSTVAPPNAAYEHSHKPVPGGYHTAPVGTYNATPTNYQTAPVGTYNATPTTNYQTAPIGTYNATPATNY